MPPPPPPREGSRPAVRAALVLLGTSIAIITFGLVSLVLFLPDPRGHRWDDAPSLVFALVVLNVAGACGVVLAFRAARSRRGTSALRSVLTRIARPVGMAFVLWPCFGLVVILATGGRPPSALRDAFLHYYWYLAAAGLLLPVSVAVHELGHWLAAFAVGLRVRVLRIGPLAFERVEGRHRVRLDWTAVSSLLGFNLLDLPEQMPSRPRSLAFILGGPVANGLAAAGCFALRTSSLGAWMDVAWVVNTYLAVLNLVPFERPGMVSDGVRALKLLRPSSSADELLYQVLRKLPAGRPREWGFTARQLSDALEGAGAARSKLLLFSYCIAQDAGEEDAQARLDAALQAPDLTREDRHDLTLQAALRAALVRSSATEARTWFEAVDRNAQPRAFYPRLAEAAVLLAEGKRAEARAALADWEQNVDASGHQAAFLLGGNEWALERLHQALDGLSASSTR